jgi:transcriptional regulator with XRE-family HTH domain
MFSEMNDFSNWLNDEIHKRGWSQNQLAKKAGLSSGTISNITSGNRGIGAETCIAIAKALKLPEKIVLQKAGIIRPDPDTTPTLEELNYKLSQLPKWQQDIVLKFVDTLIPEEGGNANVSVPPQVVPGRTD